MIKKEDGEVGKERRKQITAGEKKKKKKPTERREDPPTSNSHQDQVGPVPTITETEDPCPKK